MSLEAAAERPRRSFSLDQLFWWYLVLLALTLGFKFLCLRKIYFGGFLEILRMEAGDSGAAQAWQAGLIFSRDVLEVGLLVATLWAIGYALLRIRPAILIPASTLAVLLFSGANFLSCPHHVSVNFQKIDETW